MQSLNHAIKTHSTVLGLLALFKKIFVAIATCIEELDSYLQMVYSYLLLVQCTWFIGRNLTINNIREVLNVTWPYRSNWKFIGRKLGIDSGTLEAIEVDNMRAEGTAGECLMMVISNWLKKNQPIPTWLALSRALQSEHAAGIYCSYL